LYVYQEHGLGRFLAFIENDQVLELHFEPEEDVFIKDMKNALGDGPKLVMNKRLKYLFFDRQIAGRILDEKQGTLDILGFFSESYLKSEKLPFFFLSGIVYDQAMLSLIPIPEG
jgi:hypothetical protein